MGEKKHRPNEETVSQNIHSLNIVCRVDDLLLLAPIHFVSFRFVWHEQKPVNIITLRGQIFYILFGGISFHFMLFHFISFRVFCLLIFLSLFVLIKRSKQPSKPLKCVAFFDMFSLVFVCAVPIQKQKRGKKTHEKQEHKT